MNRILNQSKDVVSLQVSVLGNIPAGNFESEHNFLVKNITDANIEVSVKPASQEDYVTTILYPGWNPEILSAIENAPADSLQFGY